MNEITHEELLAEIERVENGQADGATVSELVEQTGRSRPMILARLKAAAKEGRLVVGRKIVPSIDGRPMWSPCYKIVQRKPSVKGKACPSQAKPRRRQK
jgi:hypothetical protein